MVRSGMPASWIFSAILILGVASCGETSENLDGGGDAIPSAQCPNGVDGSISIQTAITASEGKEVQGHICPANDSDYFKITIPAGKKLVKLQLSHTVADTGLDLTYRLVDANGAAVGEAPAWTGSGICTYSDFHCVKPGTYYVVVYDKGSDEKDGVNPYKLSYTTHPDSDPFEPNDTAQQAKTADGRKGYISCKGDLDVYKVNVSQNGKLLNVKLTNDGTTAVDLMYTIYDSSSTQIAQEVNADGMKGKTVLGEIHALPKPGSYTIVVEDYSGDESDPQRPYTLAVTQVNEQDPNETTTRNDAPKNATNLGSFSCSGGTQTYTKTGQIGSDGDVDWYTLTVPKCSTMVVMEVKVAYSGSSKVDPQVSYIYPHTSTTCSQDTCCRVLSTTCTDFLACLRTTSSCVNKGDTYCANKVCEANPSTTCAAEQRCAGAVACLPNKVCAAEQVSREDTDGSKDGAKIFTSQPLLHDGPWYIRVSDYQSDDYEWGKTYTMTVKVRTDPDGSQELNSEYFGGLVNKSLKVETYKLHEKVAKTKARKITLGQPVKGYLSYEGDQDWYSFDWPCTSASCALLVTYAYEGTGCIKGSKKLTQTKYIDDGLEFVFAKLYNTGKAESDWPDPPLTGVNGAFGYPTKCLLLQKKSDFTPVGYISVTDMGHNMWSWTCNYSFTLTMAKDGCPVPPCFVSASTGQCNATGSL